MSDTMTEGVISSWLKKEGDTVKSGDILAEVQTDKATMELENYEDGTLLYIGPKEGDAVAVDGILAIVGKKGEDISGLLNGNGNGKTEAKKEEAPKAEAPKEEKKENPGVFRIPTEWVNTPHLRIRFNKSEERFYLASFGEKTLVNEKEVPRSSENSPEWTELPINSRMVLNGIVGINIFKT